MHQHRSEVCLKVLFGLRFPGQENYSEIIIVAYVSPFQRRFLILYSVHSQKRSCHSMQMRKQSLRNMRNNKDICKQSTGNLDHLKVRRVMLNVWAA